ncbi:hypothetical protein GCM10027579_10120 [Calidifontibacter terrae]
MPTSDTPRRGTRSAFDRFFTPPRRGTQGEVPKAHRVTDATDLRPAEVERVVPRDSGRVVQVESGSFVESDGVVLAVAGVKDDLLAAIVGSRCDGDIE